MTDRSIRVSDAERESVVGRLRDAYVAGRLDQAELDERSTAAYLARTRGELADLVADLATASPPAADLPAAELNWVGARDWSRTTMSAGRRRGVLAVALVAVLSCSSPGPHSRPR